MDTKTNKMTLYYSKTCGFCHRVLRAARSLGTELDLVEIYEQPWARKMLLDRRGRGTVPVLGIPTDEGEVLLPESRDIIAYLKNNASANAA